MKDNLQSQFSMKFDGPWRCRVMYRQQRICDIHQDNGGMYVINAKYVDIKQQFPSINDALGYIMTQVHWESRVPKIRSTIPNRRYEPHHPNVHKQRWALS